VRRRVREHRPEPVRYGRNGSEAHVPSGRRGDAGDGEERLDADGEGHVEGAAIAHGAGVGLARGLRAAELVVQVGGGTGEVMPARPRPLAHHTQRLSGALRGDLPPVQLHRPARNPHRAAVESCGSTPPGLAGAEPDVIGRVEGLVRLAYVLDFGHDAASGRGHLGGVLLAVVIHPDRVTNLQLHPERRRRDGVDDFWEMQGARAARW